jgi:transposase
MNISEFKATLGLDWADRKHDIWIRPADGGKPAHRRIEHSAEALHEWVAELRARFPEGRVALGIETSRGPVISALLAYDFIVIFPINPKAMKNYRQSFGVSGAKSDGADARLIEEDVRLHGEKLKALQPDDTLTRQIGGWSEVRRQLVDDRTALINQAQARFKTYYPLALEVLRGQFNTVMAAEFLALWPDLASLQAADQEKARSFFYKHNSLPRAPRRPPPSCLSILGVQTDPPLFLLLEKQDRISPANLFGSPRKKRQPVSRESGRQR